MKKRSGFVLIISLLAGALLVGICIYGYRKVLKPEFFPEEEKRTYDPLGEYEAHYLTDIHRTDIIWYGTQYEFKFESPIRFETEYTDEVLKKREDCSLVYIILNDRDGNLDITREELQKLLDLVDENMLYYLTYLGTSKNEIIKELMDGRMEGQELKMQESFSLFHKDAENIEIWLNTVPRSLDDSLVVYYTYSDLELSLEQLFGD